MLVLTRNRMLAMSAASGIIAVVIMATAFQLEGVHPQLWPSMVRHIVVSFIGGTLLMMMAFTIVMTLRSRGR